MSPLSAQPPGHLMPPQPLITLENGGFDPKTYLQSSFDSSEIVQAENDENFFVYGIESGTEVEEAEGNGVDDGTGATGVNYDIPLHLWTILSRGCFVIDSRVCMLLLSYGQKKGKDGEVNKVCWQCDRGKSRASHGQEQNRWRIKGTRCRNHPFSGISVHSEDIFRIPCQTSFNCGNTTCWK